MLLIVTLSLCFTSIPIFASNVTSIPVTDIGENTKITPRGSSSIISYPNNTSISINGTVSKVEYTGTYNTWLGLGHSGVVVLRFTNRSTGDFKSWTFICDNGFHSDNLGYTLPSGTYDIELLVNTVKQFQLLQLQFRWSIIISKSKTSFYSYLI